MSEILRMAFVGAGEIAVESAAALAAAPSGRLVSVFDVDAGLAADLAERHAARTVPTLEALVEDVEVDAVYVGVPHAFHRDVAIEATRAGKHVFVEKPMGVSVEDAEAIVAACERAGVACGVPFVARWAPAYARAKELVISGAIGDVTGFSLAFRADKPASYWTGGWSGRATGDWRMRWASAGGGVLLMNAIHDLDAVLWITGLEIRRVLGAIATTSPPAEVEDVGVAVLEAGGGVCGSIDARSAAPGGDAPDERWLNRIYGREGQILLPTPWGTDPLLVFRRADDRWTEIAGDEGAGARAAAFEAFASAVLAGAEPPVPGADGVRASRLIHAIYDSARSGAPVDLSPR
jgi:predicted dehydrogenase